MGFCLLVSLSQSGVLVQVSQGQFLPTGKEHAAHTCTAFPFILPAQPGGMEKHHLRWNRNLNFYSALKVHASAWIRISDMEEVSFFQPSLERDKPSLHRPGCQYLVSLVSLITTCLQCHHHLSPYPDSSNELPSQVCQVLPCLQLPQPAFHRTT